MKLRVLLIFIGFFQTSILSYGQRGTITGQIKVDTSIWSPVAYLSLIPDFDEMNSMSNEIIIDQALINISGQFGFKTDYLPSGDNLIRIHISKKHDPAASLIIGGKDENHIFIIANKSSTIKVSGSSDTIFRNIKISGYQPNIQIQEINRISAYFDTTNTSQYPDKIELVRNSISEKLRYYADTCTNPIVALYAVYKSRFERNYSVNQQFYINFLSKWKHEKSSYFAEFRKKIPKIRNVTYYILFVFILVSFLLGVFSHRVYMKTLNRKKALLKDLSVQERKIYHLLIDGKTNKEISENLAIGVSTVKSHVNSIYTKLNICSRKEILNLNMDNDRR